MIVTDLGCWWRIHYVSDFFRYVGDFLNVFNRSPKSCHQYLKLVTSTFGLHHLSPTSMLPRINLLYCAVIIVDRGNNFQHLNLNFIIDLN